MREYEQIDASWALKTFEVIARLEAATTGTEVLESFGRALADIGFDSFMFVALDERDFERRVFASGWSPEWVAIYASENFKDHDPVRREVLRGANPFFWSKLTYDPEREPRAAQIMQWAADFRMNEGFSIPVRDGNSFAAISVTGRKPDVGPGVKAALQIVGLCTYNRFRALTKPPTPARRVLTDSEREALRWVAIGKTDVDIGNILNISERTARAHVSNAVHKLKAANRASAIAEALSIGEIPLNF
jgi:LuxR family quorum sensing-dependent transcriptional regulator